MTTSSSRTRCPVTMQPSLPLDEPDLEHEGGRLWLAATRLNLLALERLVTKSPDPLTRKAAAVLLAARRMVNELVEHALKDGGHE